MKNSVKILFSAVLAAIISSLVLFSSACFNKKNDSSNNSSGFYGDSDSSESTGGQDNYDLWDVSDIDISHIGKNNRLIAFTFDDGPTDKTSELIKVFADFNSKNPDFTAHATLFTIGSKITDDNAAVISEAVKQNFELGNHTYSHNDLTKLSDDKIIDELSKTDMLLKKFDNKDFHLVRPAGGHADNRVLSLYRSTFINWTTSLDTSDWQDSTTENDIYNTVVSNLLDGGIVLMHQGYDKSIKAVKRLLPELKTLDYQVVSVSELIKYYNAKAEICKLYDCFI